MNPVECIEDVPLYIKPAMAQIDDAMETATAVKDVNLDVDEASKSNLEISPDFVGFKEEHKEEVKTSPKRPGGVKFAVEEESPDSSKAGGLEDPLQHMSLHRTVSEGVLLSPPNKHGSLKITPSFKKKMLTGAGTGSFDSKVTSSFKVNFKAKLKQMGMSQVFKGSMVQRVESFTMRDTDIEFKDVLGKGACGEVYQAVMKSTGEEVAVKTLLADLPHDSHEMKDLLKEVGILSKDLQHPNIVSLKGVSINQMGLLVVLELMGGGNLEDFFNRNGKVPLMQALTWSTHMMEALVFLHNKEPSIVHRDLKPANLMLSKDRKTLKLGDFGLSRNVQSQGPNVETISEKINQLCKERGDKDNTSSAARLSKVKSMTTQTGTYRYMAPEVSTTSSYDEKVDVYSAALLVWYMITGQRPFEGIAGETVVVMVGRQRMRPQMDPKIFNKDLKALLSKACTLDHDHKLTLTPRFPSPS